MGYDFVIDVSGDKRSQYVMNMLKKKGHMVFAFGSKKSKSIRESAFTSQIEGAVNGAVYLFPPTKKLSLGDAVEMKGGDLVFAARQSQEIATILKEKEIQHINIYEEQKFALQNAVLTAEGALSIVVQNTEIALSESKVLIVGLGRVGKATAKLFKNCSAVVDVVTFDRAECHEALLFSDEQYCDLAQLKFAKYDVVINTVPAQVINEHVIKRFKKSVLLLELASSVGGFDICAVKARGLKYIQAPGLPSKTSPLSAAKILLDGVLEELGKR